MLVLRDAALSPRDAFDLAKSALLEHSIQKVREFSSPFPFRGECWFYGVTKVKQERIVIKTSVDEELKVIEVFAAASEASALTGLLAELGHDIARKLEESGSEPVQVTNLEIKDCIFQRSSLLFPDGGDDNACRDISFKDSIISRSDIRLGGTANAETDQDGDATEDEDLDVEKIIETMPDMD